MRGLLFCKYIKNRATADELFKIMDSYLKEHGLKWENCVGFCSDGAKKRAAGTNKEGLRQMRTGRTVSFTGKRSREGSSALN